MNPQQFNSPTNPDVRTRRVAVAAYKCTDGARGKIWDVIAPKNPEAPFRVGQTSTCGCGAISALIMQIGVDRPERV